MVARVSRLSFSLDPLIAEAKRRARRRRALTAVGVVALAALVTLVAVVRPGGGTGAPVALAAPSSVLLPKQLTGGWSRVGPPGSRSISVGPQGKVTIYPFGTDYSRFSRVTKHRLSISGPASITGPGACSGTGTYRWTTAKLPYGDIYKPGHQLTLTKIHDTCKDRVRDFAGRWSN
jgi:hypothetical protein